MTKRKSKGEIRAITYYSSMDKTDSFIDEAAAILRKPKPSAEEMKQVEQLKNLARVNIGIGNLRRDVLASWDKIVAGFNSMEGVAVNKFRKAV